MRDPQGSPAIWLQVVGSGLAHEPKQEGVQQLLHRIQVEKARLVGLLKESTFYI
jgi:hypothetical protein